MSQVYSRSNDTVRVANSVSAKIASLLLVQNSRSRLVRNRLTILEVRDLGHQLSNDQKVGISVHSAVVKTQYIVVSAFVFSQEPV